MSPIEETPIQATLPTPPPSGHQSTDPRLPSPLSSNDSDLREDKVDQTRSYRQSLNLGAVQEELQLLDDGTPGVIESFEHELKTAPIFTRDAKGPAGFCPHQSQYGLLGSLMAIRRVLFKRLSRDDHQLLLFF